METIEKLVRERHSVRRYKSDKIEEEKIIRLNSLINEINEKTGSNIQLVLNNSKCFDDFVFSYGWIINCKNYIALVGKKSRKLKEEMGYYGEMLVLKLMEMGLNSCWVAGSYNKKSVNVNFRENDELVCIIALGYGENNGSDHRKKSFEQVCNSTEYPDWFKKGVEFSLLAPTALNQQKFKFTYLGENNVKLKAGIGPYVKIDLGIVKYHFELGANLIQKIDINWVK